ncbi:MAG: ATP-binding protein [Planctomycetes bacterium]|nr:ATP-binding protein [Planctomycetota bacterium]
MAKKKAKKKEKPEPMLWDSVIYEDRFLEAYTGTKILQDEVTAIVELIANAWDAGATEVGISWPNGMGIKEFSIRDNGTGMISEEFLQRWSTLSYDRKKHLGEYAIFPDGVDLPNRFAFGRNGKGRFSGFCFGSEYIVETSKNGELNRYRISRGDDTPFVIKLELTKESDKHGTRIYCPEGKQRILNQEEISSEIGMRFLTDPNFKVSVNGTEIDFSNIDGEHIQKEMILIENVNTPVELIVIDTQKTDRTTKQHGVAWHVGGRLVGDCSWKGMGRDKLIDGRRIAAKRYQFIVKADCLSDSGAIKDDWSGFDRDNETFEQVAEVVYDKIGEYMLKVSEDDRKNTLSKAISRNRAKLETVGPSGRERWKNFVEQAQEACPSINENDIVKLSEIVANLEQAKTKYALIHKLADLKPEQLDDLDQILDEWTLDIAKEVLDEIGRRLKLVKEIRLKVFDVETKEVQELQPLFKEGLWIFGPEFETIEYTSNEGMTRVIQDLFGKKDIKGSRNRPDFAILPDGTAGLYSYPKYDDEAGGEIGTDRLVIVELKKPGIPISTDEKAQCWKYVLELYRKGLLDDTSRTMCYVLGEIIDSQECLRREEKEGRVIIQPLDFGTVLKRAESRLLRLQDRVKNAPFLQDKTEEIEKFLKPVDEEKALFMESA